MERNVRVNAGSGRRPEFGASDQEAGWEPIAGIHGEWTPQPVIPPTSRSGSSYPRPIATKPSSKVQTDEGPCLYLGPSGQRCDRRATKACFCAAHQPKASNQLLPQTIFSSVTITPKKIAAFFIVLAMLWPEIAKALSALIRLFR
jgi:hypothetical protein